MFFRNNNAQASVEYLLLLVVIVFLFTRVMRHIADIFCGWNGELGAIELFISYLITENLRTVGWF